MALPFYAHRSNLIFLIAVICGILFPQAMLPARILILPALTLIITITLLKFPRGFFRHIGSLLYSSLQGNAMNYLVLGNFIILTGAFLVHKQELWIGMVLVAAMPSSLETIVLGNLLRIEKNYVFTSLSGTFIGALFIVPLVGLCFLKYVNLNYWNLIVLILSLILLPLVLSRIAIETGRDETFRKHQDVVLDFSSFIVFYAITANSRSFITSWSLDLLIVAATAFVSTFLFYFLIRKAGVYFHEEENKLNYFILSGTMKECGLAGGIALTVFNREVAAPALIFAFFTFLYMNWLKYRIRHIADGSATDKKTGD